MQLTPNYNLKKPEGTDVVDIEDLNDNMNAIDEALNKKTNSTGGDISSTKVTNLDNITTSFPVPAAGENTKTFLGKVRKFIQDFNNMKTGILTVGMLVNNAVTNRSDLPVSAAVAKLLQDQVTQLNSDLTAKLTWHNGDNIASAQAFAQKYMSGDAAGKCVRFRDNTGWCPEGVAWYRCWITFQNPYNNGQFDMGGQAIFAGNSGNMYLAVFTGGSGTSVTVSFKVISLNGHGHNYLPLGGGTLTGDFSARNIYPSAHRVYNVGSLSSQFATVHSNYVRAYALYAQVLITPDAVNEIRIETNAGISIKNLGNTSYRPVHASAFNTASSRRYKSNIFNISDEEAKKVLKMIPRKFNYIGSTDTKYGMIAEELVEIQSQSISFDEKGMPNAIDYSALVPQIIKLLQLQDERINNLEKKVLS